MNSFTTKLALALAFSFSLVSVSFAQVFASGSSRTQVFVNYGLNTVTNTSLYEYGLVTSALGNGSYSSSSSGNSYPGDVYDLNVSATVQAAPVGEFGVVTGHAFELAVKNTTF